MSHNDGAVGDAEYLLLSVAKAMEKLGIWCSYLSPHEYAFVSHAIASDSNQGGKSSFGAFQSLLDPHKLEIGSREWMNSALEHLLSEEEEAGSSNTAGTGVASGKSTSTGGSHAGPGRRTAADRRTAVHSTHDHDQSRITTKIRDQHSVGADAAMDLLHFRVRSLLFDFILSLLFDTKGNILAPNRMCDQTGLSLGALEALLKELAAPVSLPTSRIEDFAKSSEGALIGGQPPVKAMPIYSTLEHDAVVLEAGILNSKEIMPRRLILRRLLELQGDTSVLDDSAGIKTETQSSLPPTSHHPQGGKPSAVSDGSRDDAPAKRRRVQEDSADEDDSKGRRRQLRQRGSEKEKDSESAFGPPRELRQLLGGSNEDRETARAAMTTEGRVLYEALEKILETLMGTEEHAWPFIKPVRKQDVPDYYDVIKKPMDFSTMSRKLQMHEYSSKSPFAADLVTIWSNCREYNSHPNSEYRKHVDFMERLANRMLDKVSDEPPSKMYLFTSSGDSEEEESAATTTRIRARHTTRGHDSASKDDKVGESVASEAESEAMSTRSTRRHAARLAETDGSEHSVRLRTRPPRLQVDRGESSGEEMGADGYGLRTGKRRNYSADNLGRSSADPGSVAASSPRAPTSETSEHDGQLLGEGVSGVPSPKVHTPSFRGGRGRGRGRGGAGMVYKRVGERIRPVGPGIKGQLMGLSSDDHELALVDANPVVTRITRRTSLDEDRVQRLLKLADLFHRSRPLGDYPAIISSMPKGIAIPDNKGGLSSSSPLTIPAVPSPMDLSTDLQQADAGVAMHAMNIIAGADARGGGPQSPSGSASAKSTSSFFGVTVPRRILGARAAAPSASSGMSSRVVYQLAHQKLVQKAKGYPNIRPVAPSTSSLRPSFSFGGRTKPVKPEDDPLALLSPRKAREGVDDSSVSTSHGLRLDDALARQVVKRSVASEAVEHGADRADHLAVDMLTHLTIDLLHLVGQQFSALNGTPEPRESAIRHLAGVLGQDFVRNLCDSPPAESTTPVVVLPEHALLSSETLVPFNPYVELSPEQDGHTPERAQGNVTKEASA